MTKSLTVIGGGLAGSEAAWQAANRGVKVTLYEMRNETRSTPAHKTTTCAELVCSNSFRSDDILNAVGLLHAELRMLNSLIMEAADKTRIPAGSALAMDREAFSSYVQTSLESHPNITIVRDEITDFPLNLAIIATGPLTSDKLAEKITHITGEKQLAFFDAIAPIVYKDSINFNIAWFQSRYDKSAYRDEVLNNSKSNDKIESIHKGAEVGGQGGDYINLPMNKEEYYRFIDQLLSAEKTEFKEWEKDTPYFNGCLPIEVMAARGIDTLLFGPMKPVGLMPPSGIKPYAVVQLRQDNKIGTLYNMVGFQTKIKYKDQENTFRLIPGLEKAEFARLGGIHRNTFINSPLLLDKMLRLKTIPNIRFAGQITGVEGYVESTAIGWLAGMFSSLELNGIPYSLPPNTTAIGALLNHITGGHITDSDNIKGKATQSFQPMNINFGLFPELSIKIAKKDKNAYISSNAMKEIKEWYSRLEIY